MNSYCKSEHYICRNNSLCNNNKQTLLIYDNISSKYVPEDENFFSYGHKKATGIVEYINNVTKATRKPVTDCNTKFLSFIKIFTLFQRRINRSDADFEDLR